MEADPNHEDPLISATASINGVVASRLEELPTVMQGAGTTEPNEEEEEEEISRRPAPSQQQQQQHQRQQQQQHVSRATYPIPEPLARRLNAAIGWNGIMISNSGPSVPAAVEAPPSPPPLVQAPQPRIESIHTALDGLVGNAIQAVDAWYFSVTPPRLRAHPAFQHRLCLRVSTHHDTQCLSITDLGIGMTRADLINGLGVGRSTPSTTSMVSFSKNNNNNNHKDNNNNKESNMAFSGGAGAGAGELSSTNTSATNSQASSNSSSRDSPTEPTDNANNNNDDENLAVMGHESSSDHVSDAKEDDETSRDGDDDDDDCYVDRKDSNASDGEVDAELGDSSDGDDDDDNDADDDGDGDSAGPDGINNTNNNDMTLADDKDPQMTMGNGRYRKKKNIAKSQQQAQQPQQAISCRAVDLGGFYAALCALGTGVRVGTKAKFDEYYEFELGVMDASLDSSTAAGRDPFAEFCIKRPYSEGCTLTVEQGFDQFHHVRGESGTCVTIRLNQHAIDAGLLDEEKLKPIFLKIVETTQYTVAFSSDPGAQDIINASRNEQEAMEELSKQADEPEMDTLDEMEIGNTFSAFGQGGTDLHGSHNTVLERSKYIPVRLSLGERKMLRLVEAAMTCCDYTTQVDRPFKSAPRRIHEQLRGVTAILRGLITACDYEAGQKLLHDDNYVAYETFFRSMFEIARRHKIMNPEKMRTEYGKLVYLLQDAVSPSLRPNLGFSVKGPITTVYSFLQERGGLDLLSDKLIETATEEIFGNKKSRAQIDHEIHTKERAVAILKKKYRTSRLSSDDIHLCLYSVCDNNSFLNSNRVPIDKVIDYLTSHFTPEKAEVGYSLSIISGEDGARLSHSHERQFYYALQSLTLWRDIIDDMFRLWAMVEEDLVSETVSYALQDTGQGMQRVQQSPRTYKAMQAILGRVQGKVKHWVGSSVIHLGDHNVPNALSFIDKYTQVPRILGPIVSCLENLERICEEDTGIRKMVNQGFGGVETLRKDILFDFFRSAFDGSGAETYYDAGSCIDGRLTSAWHWCSQLPDKPFYPIFKLTGFLGFDGEFK